MSPLTCEPFHGGIVSAQPPFDRDFRPVASKLASGPIDVPVSHSRMADTLQQVLPYSHAYCVGIYCRPTWLDDRAHVHLRSTTPCVFLRAVVQVTADDSMLQLCGLSVTLIASLQSWVPVEPTPGLAVPQSVMRPPPHDNNHCVALCVGGACLSCRILLSTLHMYHPAVGISEDHFE